MFQLEGARLLREDVLSRGLELALPFRCPVVALLLHVGLLCLALLLQSNALCFQLEALFLHLLEQILGWSHAVEHGRRGSRGAR